MNQLEQLKNKELIFLGSHMCMTKDIGIHLNLFGGITLSWLDEFGSLFASELVDSTNVVTRCIEKVEFLKPIKVGQIAKFYGGIEKIGNTSITLNIEMRKHNVHTEFEQLALSSKITFVKIDDEGNPIPISDRIKIKFGYLNPDDVYKKETK